MREWYSASVVINLTLRSGGMGVTELVQHLVAVTLVPVGNASIMFFINFLISVRFVGVEVDLVLLVLVVGIFFKSHGSVLVNLIFGKLSWNCSSKHVQLS